MPLVRIQLRAGKPAPYRRAIVDGVYAALRATYNVPEDDLFMQVEEFSGENFHFSRTYLDIPRSDDFVVLQLTVSNTRTLDQKRALYGEIVRHLAASPGLRPEDVFINLVETLRDNWSFGRGLAQYV